MTSGDLMAQAERDDPNDYGTEEHLRAALRRFGWTCGPEFDQRYLTDAWVFNLANAVDRLTSENEQLRALIDEHDNERELGRCGGRLEFHPHFPRLPRCYPSGRA